MFLQLSASELHAQFIAGKLSATEIVRGYLDKIAKHDAAIGAFLRVYEDEALKQAATLDEKRAKGEPLGKLAGVPIAIKDNIQIKGQLTTCGSKFLTNYRAPFDATVIRLLKEADAIFIGKTNMDEFAMGSSTEHSAFKKTKNPWNLDCTPGGSSGGSAAAVAARFAPLSLGSDTGGSIRQPAAYCGLVGFKPTYGRISRFGLVAFGSSLDQIGPFSTNVADAAMLMEVLGAPCDRDSTSLPKEAETYTLQTDLKGVKIGVPTSFLEGLPEEMQANFDVSIERLKSLGATIIDVDLSLLKHSIAIYYILATAEASTNLARFDGIRYGRRSKQAKTLSEVYGLSKEEGYGDEVKRRILLGTFVLSAGYQDAYYKKAQKVRTLVIEQFEKAFTTCDAIAMPTTTSGAFELGAIRDPLEMYLSDIYTIGANLAGLPAVSVPSGRDSKNKPLGLQLICPQKEDVRTLSYAHAFEKTGAFDSAEVPNV